MKTHQHAHSSAGLQKYFKKQETKLIFFMWIYYLWKLTDWEL